MRHVAAAVLLILAACGQAPDLHVVPPGSYGGEHVGMEVQASSATVEFDCAHGGIPSAIPLDDSGHFSVDGFYVQEPGGPVSTVPEERKVATYSGWTDGSTLVFTLRLTRSGAVIGTFTLQRGTPPRVFRCL